MTMTTIGTGGGSGIQRPAFGYASLPVLRRDDSETRYRRALIEAAALDGLELRSVFIDDREAPAHGFAAMRELLRRGDVRVVLLPDLGHVAHIATVAHLTRAGLGRWLNAVVLLAAAGASLDFGAVDRARIP